MKKLTLIPYILMATLMTFTACSDRQSSEQKEDKTTTIQILDQRGKQVIIKSPVNKIASAVIPAPAIIAAVDGSWDKIVGINESTLKANQDGIIAKAFPSATTTETISPSSFIPNMEIIMRLKPDVVIQWGDRKDDVVSPIENAGIPVIGLKYGTQEDLETWISMFSKLVGKEDRGNDIIENMHKSAAGIKEKVKGFNKSAPRVISLTYSKEAMRVSNKSSYDAYIFDIVGANHVSRDLETEQGGVGYEQVIAWNPEVIFLSAFSENTPEEIYLDARFKDIDAVKNKRVYRTPIGFYRWQVPCAESTLFWHWVAKLLYPSDYEINMADIMKTEIKYLYNYDLSNEDIEHILRIDLNTDSAYYDAFNIK